MHLVAYRERPDVGAVVHAHPPLSTGFAVAGIPLDRAVLAEVVTTLGSIPIAEYGTPSTRELAESVAPYVKAHDGLLLANHGALALGRDLFGAYYKMETIEHFAKISLVARMLGREHLLSREEVERLQALLKLGLSHLILVGASRDIDPAVRERSDHLLATEVLPALKELDATT
jgi:L-fuculose-phosphate aldolase